MLIETHKVELCIHNLKIIPVLLHFNSQVFFPFQHVCTFSYLPLKVGETSGKIEFTSNDLGIYTYEVNLKATPAGPEKALYFHCCLGQNQVSMAKFLNYSKQTKPDYTCKVRKFINFSGADLLAVVNSV